MKIKILVITLLTFHSFTLAKDKLFFWEIKGISNKVYLLGSIHVGKESLFPLDKKIETAFDNAEYLCPELDPTATNPMDLMKYLTYSDTTTIKSKISNKNYQRIAEELAKHNIPQMLTDKLKPWAAVVTLQQLKYMGEGFTAASGIDSYLLNRVKGKSEYSKAQDTLKNILELESVELQMNVFNEFDKIADSFVEYSLDTNDTENSPEFVTELFEFWKKGDTKAIDKLITDSQTKYPEYQNVMNELLYKRNKGMAEKIKTFLNKKDDYFIVVGSAHLVGKDSVQDYLMKLGVKEIIQLDASK